MKRFYPFLLGAMAAGAMLLSTPSYATTLWQADFVNKGLEQFQIDDINVNVNPDYFEPPSGAPSKWSVSNGALDQSSNIYGNPDPCCGDKFTARHEDTYTGTAATAKDFSALDGIFYMQFKTNDDDGIALVFRYQDEKNYLRFYSMIDGGNGGPVTRIEKWTNGVMNILAIIPDEDDFEGEPKDAPFVYRQNVRETMLCTAKGPDIACYVGDLNTPVLTATDSDPKPGSFGVSLYAMEGVNITQLSALTPDSSLYVATLNDTAGKPINGTFATLLKNGQSVAGGFTNPSGQVVFLDQAPGTYQISLGGLTVNPVPAQDAAIKAGVNSGNFTFDAKPTPVIADLSTAAGASWKIKVPADASEDFSAPDASEADFEDYEVPSDWGQITSDGINAYGWMRTHVAVPADSVGKTLVVTDFNVDDDDVTYWNGHRIGATNGAGEIRSYIVPGEWVQADNVLAIQGHNGAGPGGITTSAPKVYATNPSLTLKGSVKDPNGKPLEGVSITASSPSTVWGAQSGSAVTDAEGNFTISGLAPGTYTVTRESRLDLDPADPQTTSVSGNAGETQTASFTVSQRPSVVLSTDNGYQWTINYGTDASDDFSAANADESGFGEINVPGQLEDQGLGDDLNFYWYRLKFTLPDAMKAAQGKDLLLTNFTVADADVTYLNGQKIGQTGTLPTDPLDPDNSGGVLDWTTIRSYPVPSSLVNWTGENVLAVRAYHKDGGSGIRGTAPTLVVAPTTGPVVTLGDVNGDTKINVQDATLTLRKAVNLAITGTFNEAAADVNNDGKINVQDATLILRKAVNLPVNF